MKVEYEIPLKKHAMRTTKCRVCGTPFEYNGRGRPGTLCATHKQQGADHGVTCSVTEPGPCTRPAIVLYPGKVTDPDAPYRPLCKVHQTRLSRTGSVGTKAIRKVSTPEELAVIDRALWDICRRQQPLSVRAAYYRLESTTRLIGKEDEDYNLVQRRILIMRRGLSPTGLAIPGHWITDGTRSLLHPHGVFGDLGDFLGERAYKRDIWTDQPSVVVVLTEKDAITGTLQTVIDQYHLRYGVHRGQSSESFCWRLGQYAGGDDRPLHILQFGDHDKAGIDAWNSIQDKVTRFTRDVNPEVEVTYERLAITPEQLATVQTRDPKVKGDPERCAEVDAIEPTELRRMLAARVDELLDPDILEQTREQEADDLGVLDELIEQYEA